jgi:hypothetical protein
MVRRLTALFLLFVSPTWATTYYISQAGSDSNSGTSKAAAWQHAPYMHSFTGSYTHATGDQFIFHGGDTWTASTDYLNIPNGGASGNPDYYGVDKTWYSGASWNRPIMSIAGTLPNQDSYNESRIFAISAAWITFDNWEITGGSCSSTGPVAQNYFNNDGTYDGIVVTNGYFHAFQPPSGGCGNTKLGDGQNAAVWIYTQIGTSLSNCHGSFDHNLVDGTDGSGAKGYLTIVADPAPCAAFAYNVTHDICSGFGGNFTSAHDNVVGNFGGQIGQYECASSGGIHNHAIRTNIDANIYNNTLYDTESEVISFNPQSGGPGSYVYNNVLWANNASAIDIGDNGTNTTGAAYIFNNTIEQQSGGAYVYGNCINLENNVGTLLLANEYHIFATGSSNGCINIANPPFSVGGKGTAGTLIYNAGNNFYSNLATANSDGYNVSQTYVYSPTSAGSPTVGIGANETSYGGSNDTTYACAQVTVAGVAGVSCPARTTNARPTSGAWDAGAYEFSAVASTVGTTLSPGVTVNRGVNIR